MLLGLLASCFPTEQRPLYTCNACFKDNPTWCVVYVDGDGGFPAKDEEEARRYARVDLCLDYSHKKDKEGAYLEECDHRPMDDFLITCTSRIGTAPLHAWGCSRM
jgi:hypothetical protein